MRVEYKKKKHLINEEKVVLQEETMEHLYHLATVQIGKKHIPEEHLEELFKHGYIRHTLGGHAVTDKGYMKLMYEV